MSPQTIEDGALAFARNMKIDDDGNLVSDYGYKNIAAMADYNIVGHVVGLNDKVYFFCYTNNVSKIVEYDEITEEATPLNTAWSYSDGEIDGCVNTNQSGEKILTVAEYKEGKKIPIKHINLSLVNSTNIANVADESLYCQAPKVPITNLVLSNTYVKAIPNGVYVFFIRYKIRKDVYTNWFLCSRPVFAGTSENIVTIQGGLKFINTHRDSAKSFIFSVNHVNNDAKAYYSEFQLGFIITHDEATEARAWKHFDINTESVYFDYDDVKEINIDDLLETTYELYNVRNVASFKNKLYISNYIESDFNPDLSDLASKISVGYTKADDISADIHNRVVISGINLGQYTKANTDIGYFQVSSVSSDQIKRILNVNVSDFYKKESSEFDRALTLTLFGRSDEDPDIIYINGLTNKLENNALFGNNFTVSYNSKGDGWHDIGLDTTVIQGTDNNYYKISNYGSGHPLRGKLTFAYGLFGEIPVPSGYDSEGNIVLINSSSISDNNAIAGASFMTDDIKSTIERLVIDEIKSKERLILGYAIITSGTKKYIVDVGGISKDNIDKNNYVGSDSTDDYGIKNKNNSSSIANDIINKISSFIASTIRGIDSNGNIVLYYSGDYIKINAIEFVFKACEFDISKGDYINTNNDQMYNCEFSATLKSTLYACFCDFKIKDDLITITEANVSDDTYKQQASLMPLSIYKPYVHFVDEHNIVTNGIPLNSIIQTPGDINDLTKIKLNYSIHNISSSLIGNYKAFFISIKNIGNIIIETFNYFRKDGYNIVNVLEADALLYNINDNITIVNSSGQLIVSDAKYYPSGLAIPSMAFGNCGYVAWEDENPISGKVYIKIARTVNINESNDLIKATHYLSLVNTSNAVINDGFYGSYFCSVKKPSFSLSYGCYVSGSDIYSATRDTMVKLKEFDGYVQLQDSNLNFIRSTFNLNYLSLTEDIPDHIHKIDSDVKDIKQPIKVINSAILSYIYELKSMYKDFFNKTFRSYEQDNKTRFDNTVRVSLVLSDETFNNSIFKFLATDYYNVPTDRGIIVNLFSIANNIFVHCKRSLYKFDGNATIAANNKDIQLQESEPFDAGITQIFDSQYGYGGIDNKQAGCITFDSYFFYDNVSNHIFGYAGNSQIQMIDTNIYKLLTYYKPSECKTLHDEANNRILFEFTSSRLTGERYKTFTLSYNYKTKTFVSFHDLSLVNAFYTNHKSYSYKNKLISLFDEGTIDTDVLVEDMNVNKIFGDATTACIIEFGSQIYKKQATPFGIAVVMVPQKNIRETVDSVRYVGDVQKIDIESNAEPIYDVLINPQVTRTNPVVNFYIITDSCVSSLVTTNVDDEARPDIGHENPNDDKYYRKHNTSTTPMTPSTLMDYKGFKYDMGFWTSNYFRNKLNEADVYGYNDTVSRALGMDRNSLVYGRYFIFVFDFKEDTPIKFEELYMNTDRY